MSCSNSVNPRQPLMCELHVDDGEVTIYIQHERPSDPQQRQNWLPAPDGSFRFVFRFYGPKDDLLGWNYDMPDIIRTGEA